MAGSISFEIRGSQKLLRKFQNMTPNVERGLTDGLNRAAQLVNRRAKMLAPIDTGDLRGKIHAESAQKNGDEISASVIASSDHAVFVEFGTGVRGAGSYPYPTTLSLSYDSDCAGQVAQPYLGRALHSSEADVDKIVIQAVARAMKGGK